MANNTLIGLTNKLLGATLKNGTGGGAPARDETTPFIMENVQNSDRYHLWKTAASPAASPLLVDFDLGSNITISAVAFLGYRPAGALAVTSIAIKSAPSASGYVPAGWNDRGSITVTGADPRDFGVIVSPSASARYWRFEFSHVGVAWSIGRIWLGNPTDLGLYHSPGGLFAPYQNRLETPQPNGSLVLNPVGDAGMDIVLPFDPATTSLKTTLKALASQSGSFVLCDPDGNFYEVILKGGRVPVVRQYNSVYGITLDMQRLP